MKLPYPTQEYFSFVLYASEMYYICLRYGLNKPICRDEIDKYKSTTIIDKYVGRKMKLEVNLF